MQKLSTKINPYITKNNVILALAAIIFLLMVFNGCGNDKPLEIVKTVTHTIVKQVKQDEKASAIIIDSLKEVAVELTGDVKEAKKDLKSAEAFVTELLNNSEVIIDSSGKEELKRQLAFMKLANAAKDSLCHTVINKQDTLLTNKDNQMEEQALLYTKLRLSFNQVVENEGVKDNNIKTLKKQLRRKKAGTVFWKVAAGAAGILILKDKL